APAPVAQGQSQNPRKQLAEYVADLQKNPSEDALREKVIKLALTLEPKPKVHLEADGLAGRAKYAIEHATSKADFVSAAEAFAKASLLAPWVPEYYFNQAIPLEKAERYDDAIKNFQWYLMAAPDAKDAKEVRERIGGLKYAREKATSEAATQAEAERQRAAAAASELERKAREEADPIRKLLRSLNLSGGYRSFACSPTNIRDGNGVVESRLIRGCTEAEYNGRNWWESSAAVELPDFSGRIMN